MTITTKELDLTKEDYKSPQEYAEHTPGVFMNMLNGVSYNTVDGKYHMMPIKYSDVNMEGEKIRFANGQEYTVVFSCLAQEYANKQEVKDKWWAAANKLVESFKEARKMDLYLATNNKDLKKMRQRGELLNSDEIEKE